jgi:hypothetical protein
VQKEHASLRIVTPLHTHTPKLISADSEKNKKAIISKIKK